MPVQVFPHADFRDLVKALCSSPGRPGLRPLPVVVPSQNFRDGLQRSIADGLGLCMGWDFQLPGHFFQKIFEGRQAVEWSPEFLRWRIFSILPGYARALGLVDISCRDRFAISGLLADRLDQYDHFRPAMILRWQEESGAPVGDVERWQRDLWLRLRDSIGGPPASLELQRLRNDAEFRRERAGLFPRLIVVGAGSLDPLMVEICDWLGGEGACVEVRVILPSLGFLGDQNRRNWFEQMNREDGDERLTGEGHPLVESMGRHSYGTFCLLEKLDANFSHWPEFVEHPPRDQSLLGRLQSDIRSLRIPGRSHDGAGADGSVRIHSCFGPRREMEAVRDEILRAFRELPGLRPSDVHIVTPDYETYAPFATAVLKEGEPALPLQLSEYRLANESGLSGALDCVLRMATARDLSFSKVVELLRFPCVCEAAGDSDPEVLRALLLDAGLSAGLDRMETGTAGFSADRMLASVWLGEERESRYPDGTYALPLNGTSMASLEKFSDWLSSLANVVREWSIPALPELWAERMVSTLEKLFSTDLDSEEELSTVLQSWRQSGCGDLLDAGTMRDWMLEKTGDLRRRSQGAGMIQFARCKQLQHLPCRVLIVVGMQDGKFPSPSNLPAWDLLKEDRAPWDRDARTDDRQMFLDALLTPTERLILTASNRNPRTAAKEPFSSCVEELLRVLERMGATGVLKEQRLQPFAEEYFDGKGRLPQSFDRLSAQVAAGFFRKKEQLPAAAVPAWRGTIFSTGGEDVARVVSIVDLVRCWKNPSRHFLRAQAVRSVWRENPDEWFDQKLQDAASVPWGELYGRLMAEALESQAGGVREALLRSEAAAAGCLPSGELESEVWQVALSRSESFRQKISQSAVEYHEFRHAWAGGLELLGRLPVNPRTGGLQFFASASPESPQSFFEYWIGALLFSAATGRSVCTTLLAMDSKSNAPERCETEMLFRSIPREAACMHLDDLLSGLGAGASRPLRYAPKTSEKLSEQLAAGESVLHAVAAARFVWEQNSQFATGEGNYSDVRVVWRGRDPFEEPQEWIDWAEKISDPLRKWRAGE